MEGHRPGEMDRDSGRHIPLLQRHAPRRIIILRALPGLGDLLCAVPAFRALRRTLPDAQIDLLGLASTRNLVRRYSHYIDNLIDFPGFPGLPEQTPQIDVLPAFLTAMHRQQYDLAIQVHGDGSFVNILTLLLGAEKSAGFYLPHQFCPDEQTYLPYPQQLHEIQRNLALMKHLGASVADDSLEFPLTPDEEHDFKSLLDRYDLKPGHYACIHAGSSTNARRWPPEAFAHCGRWLQTQGLQLVLTGTESEAPVNAQIASRLGEQVVDLSGQTGLGALALLLRNARLLLCNDTGVSHLAAAMRAPSVVIFLDSERRRWAPLDRSRHIPVGTGQGHTVSTAEVCTALKTLLEQTVTEENTSNLVAHYAANLAGLPRTDALGVEADNC